MAASSTTTAPSTPRTRPAAPPPTSPPTAPASPPPSAVLGRYLAQPKHWFSPTATPRASPVFAVPFDVDPRADRDGVARWLADILRALADTSRDASDADERAARLEAAGVQANALLSRWRDASDADERAARPGCPSPSRANASLGPGLGPDDFDDVDDEDEEAFLERDAQSRAVASAVKDLLRSASRTDDRGFRRSEERPPVDDAGSGGAVSRLCDAVQSALDHRARRTLGRRVSDALGLDRL